MTKPTYVTGDVPTASEINEWFVGVNFARKSSTESVTSSTTLQDDDDLSVAVLANGVYVVECHVFYDAATAGDLKLGWSYPAAATGTFTALGLSPSPAPPSSSDDVTATADIATAFNLGGAGTGTTLSAFIKGLLVVSSTAGNFRVQWSQVSSTGTATRLFSPSYLLLRRVV